MATLTKTIGVNYVPANPGTPGFPGTPAVPQYWTRTCSNIGSGNCRTFFAGSTVIFVNGAPIMYQQIAYVCTNSTYTNTYYTQPPPATNCVTRYYGPQAAVPPIAYVAPTPAQSTQLFYPGWNASGMSIPGVAVGQGAQFRVQNGSMGVLVSLAPATWTPNIVTAQFGIMFQAGGFSGQPSSVTAMIWENGVPVQPLGTFINGQNFVLGRSTNNKIVYWNQTQNIMITRPLSILPPPTVPMQVFAQFYYGGDACIA